MKATSYSIIRQPLVVRPISSVPKASQEIQPYPSPTKSGRSATSNSGGARRRCKCHNHWIFERIRPWPGLECDLHVTVALAPGSLFVRQLHSRPRCHWRSLNLDWETRNRYGWNLKERGRPINLALGRKCCRCYASDHGENDWAPAVEHMWKRCRVSRQLLSKGD
jgi:hypothetical protein